MRVFSIEKGVVPILALTLAVGAGLAGTVQADKQDYTPIPKEGAVRMLWWSGETPTTIQDIRLSDLEDTAGILRWAWGMEVPAGKKMVFHLSGGKSTGKSPMWQDSTYEVTGPLGAAFNNRFSIIRHATNNDQTEQLFLDITAQRQDQPHRDIPPLWRSMHSALAAVDMEPGSVGDRGGSQGGAASLAVPVTIWEQHLGPKDAPNAVYYKLDVWIAPADKEAVPGEIVSLK